MQVTMLVIGGVGILLLLVSLVLGDVVDGFLDGIGPDLLSGLAVAGFLAAFGFVGALTLSAGASGAVAIIAGLVAGVAAAAAAGYASQRLMRGGDESTVRSAGLVGLTGTVVEPVPDDGYGMVSVVAAGHITRLNARSDEPLGSGTAVVVTAVLSPTSVRVARRPA
jgi:membrane protein implicated in regulation of membrane protease activity